MKTVYDTTPEAMRSRARGYATRAAQLTRQASKAHTADEVDRYLIAARLYRDAVRNLIYKADEAEWQAMQQRDEKYFAFA